MMRAGYVKYPGGVKCGMSLIQLLRTTVVLFQTGHVQLCKSASTKRLSLHNTGPKSPSSSIPSSPPSLPESFDATMSTESQEDPGVHIRPGDDGGSDKPIATQARDCDSNFVKSITYMVQSKEGGHAGILRALHARFTDWAGYLGVFSMKSASLDRRLERNKHYRDLVLLVLSMLNSRLLQSTFFKVHFIIEDE